MNTNIDKRTSVPLEIMRILKLHVGIKQRISRDNLRMELEKRGYQISDRSMREGIELLRMGYPEGALICSSTKGGYWMAETMEEIQNYLHQDERRAQIILARLKRQKDRAYRAIRMTPLPISMREK